MGQFNLMTVPGGVLAWLVYNDNNLQIKQAGYDNPSSKGVHVTVWEDGSIVYDEVLPPGADTTSVPGNYRLRETDGPDGTELRLPIGVELRIQWPAGE